MKTDTASDDLAPFEPLGSYAWPIMPAQETLRRWAGRGQGLLRNGDKPLIADDQLRKTTRYLLDEVVAPPACGPLERELDKTIIRLVLLVLAILWVIPIIFNVTFQNFLVLAGGASLAIGFAFKDYVSSLIAGIVAIFERPYRPGDWVKIGDDYGEVRSVGMRSIRVLTAEANMITIPHLSIWTKNISNSNDGERTLMCIADFYLAPGYDAAIVRAALQNVGLTSAYLHYDRPVAVMLSETPWGAQYRLKAYPFDMRDQFSFISDLTVRGKRVIVEAGAVEVTAPVAAKSPH